MIFYTILIIFVSRIIFTMEQDTEKKKQERGVVHLVLKSTGENFFYGNLKALFDNQEQQENDKTLGVSYNYLKNYDFSNGRTYENDKCVIRKGVIDTSTKKEWKRNNKNIQRWTGY